MIDKSPENVDFTAFSGLVFSLWHYYGINSFGAVFRADVGGRGIDYFSRRDTIQNEHRVQGRNLPHFIRGEVMRMSSYEVFALLFLGGNFLIALLTYIDRHNKKK